jgi:hypothetical protein
MNDWWTTATNEKLVWVTSKASCRSNTWRIGYLRSRQKVVRAGEYQVLNVGIGSAKLKQDMKAHIGTKCRIPVCRSNMLHVAYRSNHHDVSLL